MQPSSPCGRAVGGSQYRDDQFPRKTGEIDSARSHMNVSAIFPFTSAIIRRASHTPLPSPASPPGSRCASFVLFHPLSVLLCIDNTRCVDLEKVSTLLPLSPSRASDGKWFFFLFLFFFFSIFFTGCWWYLWLRFGEVRWTKNWCRKKISEACSLSFRGLNSRWIKT